MKSVELILQKALGEAGIECEVSNIKVEGYCPDIKSYYIRCKPDV